jgi:hypothetical protein
MPKPSNSWSLIVDWTKPLTHALNNVVSIFTITQRRNRKQDNKHSGAKSLVYDFDVNTARALQLAHIMTPRVDDWCLRICPSVAPKLVSCSRRSVCKAASVCNQKVIDCFTSVAVANRSPDRPFWRGPKRREWDWSNTSQSWRRNQSQVWFAACGRKDFRLFRPLKKRLVGTPFAIDADVKQAVTSRLRTLETDFL